MYIYVLDWLVKKGRKQDNQLDDSLQLILQICGFVDFETRSILVYLILMVKHHH